MKNILNSFKPDRKFGIIIVIDLIFYLAVAIIFNVFAYIHRNLLSRISHIPTDQAALLLSTDAQLDSYNALMQEYLAYVIIGAVVFTILVLFAYKLSRVKIYEYLLDKKIPKKEFWKMNILNIILVSSLVIVLYLLLSFVQGSPNLIFVILALGISFIIFAEYYYIKSGLIFASIGEAFGSFNKFKLIITGVIFFVILSHIALALNKRIYTENITVITSLIAIVIYSAWLRSYLLRDQ